MSGFVPTGFSVPDDVFASLNAVRADSSSTDFTLIGWDTPTSLKVLSSSDGGLSALIEALPANDVAYGLLRQNFTWESVGDVSAETVKFVFVYWFPDSGVPLMRKMKVGTFEGETRKLFADYHVDLSAGNLSEISADIVKTLLENVTGKADHTGAEVIQKKEEKYERKFVGGMSGKTQELPMVDEAAVMGAIADVRNDTNVDAEWVIVSFDVSGRKPALQLKATGSGGLESFKAALDKDSFNYGIFRLTETIDETEAVKFCFIKSQPEATPFRQKGKLGMLTGAVASVMAPFHGDVFVDTVDELTLDSVVLATKKR